MRIFLTMLCLLPLVGCSAPITTEFHRAMTNRNGFVLDVHNDSDKVLHCKAKTEDNSISYDFLLDPYAEEHIGLLQIGRSFTPGERGDIEVNGYLSHDFAAPQ